MKKERLSALEGRRCKIYRIIERELSKDGPKHLNFSEIAKEIGCCWTTVSYHYKALRAAGYIGVKDGAIYIIQPARKTRK